MYSDYHVHSTFSNDSRNSIKDICLRAIEKGMESICITDHIDAVNHQKLNRLQEIEKFFKEIENAQKEFVNQIALIPGFEFSEPTKNMKLYEDVLKYPFEYKMCTVHHCRNGCFPTPRNIEINRAVKEYLENVKETVQIDGIDSLGHIDLIRRYYGAFPFVQEQLDDIFRVMIQRNIYLEINTSSFLRSIGEIPFYIDYLERYIALGGQKIVIGSDAHELTDIGRGFEELILDGLIPKK